MKTLGICGSLRKNSFNKKLLETAFEILIGNFPDHQHAILSADLFSLPIYNADVERDNPPLALKEIQSKIKESSALIIVSPEYNGGIASPLKNFLDWVSRLEPMPWKNKPILLLSGSPGALGGVRGLWHTRVPFEAVGSYVYTEMYGWPQASEAGLDDKARARLKNLLQKFIAYAGALHPPQP